MMLARAILTASLLLGTHGRTLSRRQIGDAVPSGLGLVENLAVSDTHTGESVLSLQLEDD